MTATVDRGETRRSARSAAIGLVGAAASGLFGFVLAVVVTRGYGPAGAGAFFTAVGLLTVACAVCTLGAETGLLWSLPRRRTGPDGDAARMVPVALIPPLVLAGVAAVAGLLAAPQLAAVLFDPATAGGRRLVQLCAVGLPVLVAVGLLLATVRAVRPIGAYVSVQFFLLPIGRPLLVGLAAFTSGAVLLGMSGWLLPAVIAVLVCAALVVRPLGVGAGAAVRPGRGDWRTFWRFALPRAGSAAIDAGGMWVGVLLAAILAGPAAAGLFGAVGRYVLAGQLALQGLRVAVAPQLSRLLGEDRRTAAAAVHRQLTTWALVLSWPVYLLLAVFAPGFLSVFGPEFTAGAAAMTWLSLAMLVNVAVGNVQTLLLMSGRSGLHLLAAAANLVVTVSLGLWWIPQYGVSGAAVAWGTGIVVENLIAWTAARIVIGRPLVDRSMLIAATAVSTVVGAAAALAVAVAGRDVTGLGYALATLAVVAAGTVALPGTRRRLWRGASAIRGIRQKGG
ncbi:lipopolysaccharide biosynthesis protein [Solwaraspora sp. WMMD406]|uniref:lipopolysaccharide biosynthesis protein n=1 Tax=Solwaraspora sp. WMMD406 TaxID=3016095 RepID=UPI002416A548|nr:lipopolysaccharide biosynthesis protein [Solwaraspora sp. WMMD406]MDG4767504.1 lipopolysaccharide biosynthesis protein [Solwaraspora sp. WMMD406]